MSSLKLSISGNNQSPSLDLPWYWQKRGWLKKKSGPLSLKLMYVLISPDEQAVCYYKNWPTDFPTGFVPLNKIIFVRQVSRGSKNFTITTQTKTYEFKAERPEDAVVWVEAVSLALTHQFTLQKAPHVPTPKTPLILKASAYDRGMGYAENVIDSSHRLFGLTPLSSRFFRLNFPLETLNNAQFFDRLVGFYKSDSDVLSYLMDVIIHPEPSEVKQKEHFLNLEASRRSSKEASSSRSRTRIPRWIETQKSDPAFAEFEQLIRPRVYRWVRSEAFTTEFDPYDCLQADLAFPVIWMAIQARCHTPENDDDDQEAELSASDIEEDDEQLAVSSMPVAGAPQALPGLGHLVRSGPNSPTGDGSFGLLSSGGGSGSGSGSGSGGGKALHSHGPGGMKKHRDRAKNNQASISFLEEQQSHLMQRSRSRSDQVSVHSQSSIQSSVSLSSAGGELKIGGGGSGGGGGGSGKHLIIQSPKSPKSPTGAPHSPTSPKPVISLEELADASRRTEAAVVLQKGLRGALERRKSQRLVKMMAILSNDRHWMLRAVEGCAHCRHASSEFFHFMKDVLDTSRRPPTKGERRAPVTIINLNILLAMVVTPPLEYSTMLNSFNVHSDVFSVFNMPVYNSGLWRGLLKAISQVNLHARRHALRDINGLLLRNSLNTESLLDPGQWAQNLFALFSALDGVAFRPSSHTGVMAFCSPAGSNPKPTATTATATATTTATTSTTTSTTGTSPATSMVATSAAREEEEKILSAREIKEKEWSHMLSEASTLGEKVYSQCMLVLTHLHTSSLLNGHPFFPPLFLTSFTYSYLFSVQHEDTVYTPRTLLSSLISTLRADGVRTNFVGAWGSLLFLVLLIREFLFSTRSGATPNKTEPPSPVQPSKASIKVDPNAHKSMPSSVFSDSPEKQQKKSSAIAAHAHAHAPHTQHGNATATLPGRRKSKNHTRTSTFTHAPTNIKIPEKQAHDSAGVPLSPAASTSPDVHARITELFDMASRPDRLLKLLTDPKNSLEGCELQRVLIPKSHHGRGVHWRDGLNSDLKLLHETIQFFRTLHLLDDAPRRTVNVKKPSERTARKEHAQGAKEKFDMFFGVLSPHDQQCARVIIDYFVPFFTDAVSFMGVLQKRIADMGDAPDLIVSQMVKEFLTAKDTDRVEVFRKWDTQGWRTMSGSSPSSSSTSSSFSSISAKSSLT